MLENIYNDSDYSVAIHPILSEEQCNSKHLLAISPNLQVKSVKRKCEWLTTHKVLHEMLCEPVTYTYDIQGKPILNKRSEQVSISHSKNYSAIIVSNKKRVGIDIEELNPRIYKISEKFVSPYEQVFINSQYQKIELLYIIWCAKEALYKLSQTSIDFKEQIIIENFTLNNSGTFNAIIIQSKKTKQYKLHYRLTEKFVLVWVVE